MGGVVDECIGTVEGEEDAVALGGGSRVAETDGVDVGAVRGRERGEVVDLPVGGDGCGGAALAAGHEQQLGELLSVRPLLVGDNLVNHPCQLKGVGYRQASDHGFGQIVAGVFGIVEVGDVDAEAVGSVLSGEGGNAFHVAYQQDVGARVGTGGVEAGERGADAVAVKGLGNDNLDKEPLLPFPLDKRLKWSKEVGRNDDVVVPGISIMMQVGGF